MTIIRCKNVEFDIKDQWLGGSSLNNASLADFKYFRRALEGDQEVDITLAKVWPIMNTFEFCILFVYEICLDLEYYILIFDKMNGIRYDSSMGGFDINHMAR